MGITRLVRIDNSSFKEQRVLENTIVETTRGRPDFEDTGKVYRVDELEMIVREPIRKGFFDSNIEAIKIGKKVDAQYYFIDEFDGALMATFYLKKSC